MAPPYPRVMVHSDTDPATITCRIGVEPELRSADDGRSIATWGAQSGLAFLALDDVAEQAAQLTTGTTITVHGRWASAEIEAGDGYVTRLLVDRIERGSPPAGTPPGIPPSPTTSA